MMILLIAVGTTVVGVGMVYYLFSGRRSSVQKDSETWENLWMSRLDR
ncbi:MAG: hypothetical protein PF637_12250 [Spirochaetes bacterium]|jgi:hypothetical protein|nr:hypothetical protein [Spirochaetota bacterium]